MAEAVGRAVEAVAERDRYRDLFEFAPSGYLVTDAEGAIRELNRAACELLGITPRYAAGKPLAVFVRKEDRPAFHKQLTALQKGEPAWETLTRRRPMLRNLCLRKIAGRDKTSPLR